MWTSPILTLHSILRWIVVVIGVVVTVRAAWGWLRATDYGRWEERLGKLFPIAIDVQTLVGLLLWFVGGTALFVFQSFGRAVARSDTRYFALEHPLIMLVALVLAHVGRARVKRVDGALAKHKAATIFFGLALIAVLVGIPWFRPLLRMP